METFAVKKHQGPTAIFLTQRPRREPQRCAKEPRNLTCPIGTTNAAGQEIQTAGSKEVIKQSKRWTGQE
jgi:hypothetical protein